MTVQEQAKRWVLRGTGARKGRHLWVSPKDGVLKALYYGRIVLDRDEPKAAFETGSREVGLICVGGSCLVTVGNEAHELGRHDAIYLPPRSSVVVTTGTSVDLMECAADVTGNYPVQVVRHKDVEKDPSLTFATGADATSRTINVLLGHNVRAGRIMAGFTRSAPGHWTSWPPHEHGAMLEELYAFYDMPAPAFGIQFVYTDPEAPEFVEVVRDGDVVCMPRGYHPNVAIPGHSINFVWLMAAHREVEDRKFGVVNVQPEFGKAGSGLERGKK
jgi:5-deoxy-glucuronate isomerase